MPLGAFAQDNATDSTCQLYIQNLNSSSDSVILGSMFFQQVEFVQYQTPITDDLNSGAMNFTVYSEGWGDVTFIRDLILSDLAWNPFNSTLQPTRLNVTVND